MIQTRDLSDGKLDMSLLDRIKSDGSNGYSLLKSGDVLFKAKSRNPVAAAIMEEIPPTIATSHFFILTLTDAGILPAYLAWYLNQRPAQRHFKSMAAGTRVPIVNLKSLKELEVAVPEPEIQNTILTFDRLAKREKTLMQELSVKRAIYAEAAMLHILNETADRRRQR